MATDSRSYLDNYGVKVRDTAFMYLITGSGVYRDAAKISLLNLFSSIDNTKTFFDSACYRGVTTTIHGIAPDAYFVHALVITRIALAYDYIR